MKHNVKLLDGTTQTLDCKLGSGITDKNGKEIFEGDILSNGKKNVPVLFYQGGIVIEFSPNNYGSLYDVNAFEIVGHVGD